MQLLDLVQIRSYVRSEINQEDTDGFVSEAEIDRWANEAYYKYVNKLIEAEQGYFETTKSLDLVADTEAVALPINFSANQLTHHKTVRVERVLANGNMPLNYRRRNTGEFNATQGHSGSEYLPNWDFRGSSIILEPRPLTSETAGLLLVYGALPARLESATAAAGAASTITLASTADPRDDYYNGARIYIASGTGSGQIRTISDYVGSTKVATVSVAWSTQPTSSSVYSVLMHDDFPVAFQTLIPLYATKKAFLKERSRGITISYDGQALKEMERDFDNFISERTAARKFIEPWHPELC